MNMFVLFVKLSFYFPAYLGLNFWFFIWQIPMTPLKTWCHRKYHPNICITPIICKRKLPFGRPSSASGRRKRQASKARETPYKEAVYGLVLLPSCMAFLSFEEYKTANLSYTALICFIPNAEENFPYKRKSSLAFAVFYFLKVPDIRAESGKSIGHALQS